MSERCSCGATCATNHSASCVWAPVSAAPKCPRCGSAEACGCHDFDAEVYLGTTTDRCRYCNQPWEHPCHIKENECSTPAPILDFEKAEAGQYLAPHRGKLVLVSWAAELERQAAEAVERGRQQEKAKADAIFRWLLGEEGEFPERPDSVPGKPYPYYYWRSHLRAKLEVL